MSQFCLSRTLGVVLLAFAAVLFYVMVFMQFFKSNSFVNQLRKQNHKQQNVKLSSISTTIVLLSQPRSGSTFLGDFLKDLYEETLDFYEPLQALLKLNEVEQQPKAYKAIAKSFLHQLFRCHFTDDSESTLRSVFSGFFSRSAANVCRKLTTDNVKLCREPRVVVFNRLFSTYRTLFVKLLEPRLPFRMLSLAHMATKFSIVYLIRDPRASFWSLLNKGWVTSGFNSDFRQYAANRCKEMHENLQKIEDESKRNQIIILRYEDMLQSPLKFLKLMSTFLNKDIPGQNLKQFMMKLRNNAVIGCRSAQEKRWPNWYADAQEEFVEFIEGHCEAVMNMTGYKMRDKMERNVPNCNGTLIAERDSVELLNRFSDPYDEGPSI